MVSRVTDDASTVGLDRPLIAYAFLAQTKSDPSDLMSGLTPIFIPIAKQLQGEIFSADVFSEKLKDIYGIKIHPWAVDDLTPRLEACGILAKVPLSEGTANYVYAIPPDSSPADEVTESHIRALLLDFTSFAETQFKIHDLVLENSEAEQVFLEHLILTDFSSIRLRAKSETKDPRILSLHKSVPTTNADLLLAKRAQLDIICASYILEMFEKNRAAYDLIVRVAHGALLAEVVLNVQDPKSKVDLKALTVILDAPIVMSILDVRAKESTTYARAFLDDIRAKGASVRIFAHSVEEIELNLKSVVSHVARGEGHGATARRLIGSEPFRVYIDSVRADVRGAIERIGINVTDSATSAQNLQDFTEEDEAAFCASLGFYNNHQAQIRDANSVASTVRLRRGASAMFKNFEQSSYIFITENDRVADRSSKLTGLRQKKHAMSVPPVLTDRFFAGLMWVTFGGKTDEITQHRLLASCVSALEPRTDVLAKVHHFLAELDDQKADHFRALMTEERSGQHVMQLTLGDALLVRSTDDASELLKKLEDRYIEKGKKSVEDELKSARRSFDEEMVQKLAEHEEAVRTLKELSEDRETATVRQIADLENGSATDSMKIAMLEGTLRDFHKELSDSKERALQKDLKLLVQSAKSARWIYMVAAGLSYALFLLAIVVSVLASFLLKPDNGPLATFATLGFAVIVAVIGFWKIPDLVFGRVASYLSEQRFEKLVSLHSLEALVIDCEINLRKGTVKHLVDSS